MADTDRRIAEMDNQLAEHAKSDDACRRVMAIPGIGPVNATALVATIGDASSYKSGRQLGAWIGLVPRQSSSGCKERLGHITKAGDAYLRRMLINGARVVVRWRRKTWPWLAQLLARRPANVAIVALAHKLARIVWAVLARGEDYRPTMEPHNSPSFDKYGAVLVADKAKPLTRRPKRPALSATARGTA
jgi:transposase